MNPPMDFAFIINSPNYSFVANKYKVAKHLPVSWIKFWCLHWPPVFVSKISGLKSVGNNKEVSGCLIGIPMTGDQMLNHRKLAYKRVVQACKKAERLGVKLIGLAAFPSYITKGGTDLKDTIKTPVANGQTLTASTAVDAIEIILNKEKINFNQIKIAIVGATDLVGRGISKLLATKIPKELILIGKTPGHLFKLKESIKNLVPDIELSTSIDITEIKNAEIIIVASASTKIIINPENVKKNAIIYDVSYPQNVNPNLIKTRPDIKVIDGSLIFTPGINYHFNLGLPKEVVFSCLSETMLLSSGGIFEDATGDIDLQNINVVKDLAKYHNFSIYLNIK